MPRTIPTKSELRSALDADATLNFLGRLSPMLIVHARLFVIHGFVESPLSMSAIPYPGNHQCSNAPLTGHFHNILKRRENTLKNWGIHSVHTSAASDKPYTIFPDTVLGEASLVQKLRLDRQVEGMAS